MPNWVSNGLTIEGDVQSISKLKEQVGKPYTMPVQSLGDLDYIVKDELIESEFSFWNIFPPTDLVDYPKQPWFYDGTDTRKAVYNSWYNFNNREWGCKWDASDVYSNPSEDGERLYYDFNTPWGPPVQAIEKLASQYPELDITLDWQEEQGFGGQLKFSNGECVSESEYESKCLECDAEDTMSYCDNECGPICSACNWLGEADLEAVAECQTHKIYLETNVPEYRKAEA